MEKKLTIGAERVCEVFRCTVRGMGLELDYRMERQAAGGGTTYVLCVRMGAEEACADLGGDFFRAAERCRAIVAGAVTPCALRDVAADFTEAEKSGNDPLQFGISMV